MIRRHVLTGDPILFAPERSLRPNAFGEGEATLCPFCPGNERETPPEVARLGNATAWRARVVPNKYPAADHHEVVIEAADHAATFADVDDEIIDLYAGRLAVFEARSGVEYVSLFKNHGTMAGATLSHLHSQIIALPFVPLRIQRELLVMTAGQCAFCEEPAGEVIHESEQFRVFAPHASPMNYQSWIVPRRHLPSLSACSAEERQDLVGLLKRLSRGLASIAASYNWGLISFPSPGHFYLDAFPRMTPIAGFELGTGTFIETVDAAATAARLRPCFR